MALVLGDELLFPSEYLAFVDLKGKAVPVQIESMSLEDLRTQAGAKRKPIARLTGKKKKLVLNKTNCQRIAELYGNQAAEWVGKVIVIKPDKDRFGGKMVDCIRVDVQATKRYLAQQKQRQPAAEPAHDPGTGEVEDDYLERSQAEAASEFADE